MDFCGKRVLIVGLARSGLAAVSVLHKHGAIISVCDKKRAEEIEININELKKETNDVFLGAYPIVKKEDYDFLVVSPGVPLDIAPIREASIQGIPLIGEAELAYLIKADTVEFYAITGTNGKTTTTSLLQYILGNAGRNSFSAGNIGIPLSSLVDGLEEAYVSVEMSSFQLETSRNFRPHICGVLNISPDHLDRHKNMEAYIAAKSRIFANQAEEDFALLNYEDPIVRDMAQSCKSQLIFFSTERVLKNGVYIENNMIKAQINDDILDICPLESIIIRGRHNLENILCAAGIALVAGVSPEIICYSLKTFRGVRHRMEEVSQKNGVLYINDSKATNPESVIKALESFIEPVVLIAGGRNKGSNFSGLASVIKDKVKALILLGEAKKEMETAVMNTGFSNIYEVGDFDAAVLKASELAVAGDVVLLSPACASWDMFASYEHRGDRFCELVREMD